MTASVRLPPPASETTKGESDPLRGFRAALESLPYRGVWYVAGQATGEGLSYSERHFTLLL